MSNKKLTGTLIPKDNKKAKMHATFYSDKPIGGGGDSEIFDEHIDATDAQRNTALANVSNQTANSTTGKMGYKVLDGSKSFASQVTAENTIYEIRDVFDLGGTQETPVSVTLPTGSTLKFNGGKIKNCTINSDYFDIEANKEKIFDNVKFTGYCTKQFFKIEWFVDVCTNKVLSNTNLCAASQFEEALNSGIMNLTIGRDRYYPLQRTIDYTGNANIFAESDYNLRGYSESRNDDYYFPCIYSNTVVTLIDYKFKDTAISGRYTQSLYLQGLFLLANKPYTDLSEKETPILKVTAKTQIWGLTIDCCIRNVDRYIVVDTDGEGYYISSATVHQAYLPNRTAIELVTDGGYMSNVTINGNIQGVYKGVKATKISSNGWMTAMNFNAATRCAIGCDLGSYFTPLIVTGQHQTYACFSSNDYTNYSYFTCDGISNQGFVYDVGTSNAGIYSVSTALRVINNTGGQIILDGIQAGQAKVDYPYYMSRMSNYIKNNNGIDLTSKSINLLHETLNSNQHIALTACTYKVTCEDTTINMFNWGNAENTFMTLTNQINLFASNFDISSNNISANIERTDLACGYVKQAYYNKTLNFEIHIEGSFERIGYLYDSSVLMLRFPLNLNNITVTINDSSINLDSASFHGDYVFIRQLPNTFVIDITYSFIDDGISHLIAFPFVYIPYIHGSKFSIYEGWVPLKGCKSTYFYRPINASSPNRNRIAMVSNNEVYDSDGFLFEIKKGTTSERPSISNVSEGYQYYDTDLKKWIMNNGTAWVNLDGTPLS